MEYLFEDPNGYGTPHRFRPTEWFRGQVWNIGRHNFPHECYIPLVTEVKNYTINPDTLYAFKVESEELALMILKEAGHHEVHYCDYQRIVKEYHEKKAKDG